MIQREWLQYFEPEELPEDFGFVIQSWDTAVKSGEDNSFHVCTTWGMLDRHFYLLDVFRQRCDFKKLVQHAEMLSQQFTPGIILVEAQATGQALADFLNEEGYPVEHLKTTAESKALRLQARLNKFTSGQVHLPAEAPWLKDYEDEITSFPASKFSDQVDSTVQALAWDSTPGNVSFANAIGALKLMTPGGPSGREELVKIRALQAGSITGYGPNVINHSAGEILEVPRDLAGSLCRNPWNYEWVVEDTPNRRPRRR